MKTSEEIISRYFIFFMLKLLLILNLQTLKCTLSLEEIFYVSFSASKPYWRNLPFVEHHPNSKMIPLWPDALLNTSRGKIDNALYHMRCNNAKCKRVIEIKPRGGINRNDAKRDVSAFSFCDIPQYRLMHLYFGHQSREHAVERIGR